MNKIYAKNKQILQIASIKDIYILHFYYNVMYLPTKMMKEGRNNKHLHSI